MSRGPWKKGAVTREPEYYTRKQMAWRVANNERHKAGVRARQAKYREFLWVFKRRPCMDCGVQYPPYAMQFDHRDPAMKKFTIGSAIGRAVDVILAEIAKCDVVCANCHAARTWRQQHTEE